MTSPIMIVGERKVDEPKMVIVADGPDEDLAYAAKLLTLLTPHFANTKPAGALTTAATWPAVIQLANAFGSAWHAGPRLVDWISRELAARTSVDPDDPGELTVATPGGKTARSYQVAGAKMIAATGKSLIFDEPGTGKTITTILGLVERAAAGHPVWPTIVLCPASVVDPWVREFQAWAPDVRAVAWRGTPDQRRRLIGHHDVYVTSYDTARRDAKDSNPSKSPLIALGAVTVVADEVHKIKNHDTAQSRAVRRLAKRGQNFVGLSGTPITHHPANIWPALAAMEAEAWPSRERWVGRYCLTGHSDYGEDILGLAPHAADEFWTCLMGQHRRVAKADVAKELPPKVYSVRYVELPTEYRRAYDEFERDMLAELPDDGGEISAMSVLAQLQHLSVMASAAGDVEVERTVEWDEQLQMEVEKTKYHIHLREPSWKVDALLEVLEERTGEQVVVFASSRQLIDLAGKRLEEAGYRVGYVKGGQNQKHRTRDIEAFQAGELDVMCVVTQAGGVGITLTAARTAVFLQRPWSLVDATQAEDRLHRIGAKHETIEIIDIVASKTVDTRVRQVLKERAGALSEFVKDPRIAAELLGGSDVTRTKQKARVEAAAA